MINYSKHQCMALITYEANLKKLTSCPENRLEIVNCSLGNYDNLYL